MRRAAVGAIFLVAAATASAFIPPPRERPPTLEEAANEMADYRAGWTPHPYINLYWEVIFEGAISDYEVISLPTPRGDRLSCTRITFAVERGIAGEPDSVIQALTIAFPTGSDPPAGGILAFRSDQVPLPMVGSRGLFFLRRAGQQEGWANNASRLVFSGGRGSWIENARGVAIYDVTEPPETYDYDRLVTALDVAVHVRSLSQLASQASVIARVTVGRRVDMRVGNRKELQVIHYPITIAPCYRGALGPGPGAIVFEDRTLTDTRQERYLVENSSSMRARRRSSSERRKTARA